MSLKLVTLKSKMNQSSIVPGLLEGSIEYEIKGGTSNAKWTGPKISREAWNQVLSFFKWSWDETKAEAQVRFFVNALTGQWTAWAFPQEARSSAATKELESDPRWEAQREQFKLSDGWQYIGTAHHHCNFAAFQSGTDKNNETGQDGLHVTIGNLDAGQYDLHARFYFAGCEFAPDMADFWEVGEEVRRYIPATVGLLVYDAIARGQMTQPAPVPPGEAPAFPEQWKENIVRPVTTITPYHWQGGYKQESFHTGNGAGATVNKVPIYYEKPVFQRKEDALKMLRGRAVHEGIDSKTLVSMLDILSECDVFALVCEAAELHNITAEDVIDEWRCDEELFNAREEANRQIAEGGNPRGINSLNDAEWQSME